MKKWRLVDKRPIGLYMSGAVQGPGWGNPGYYHAIFEVTESCGLNTRVRVENGPACRDYSEGYYAAASLYGVFFERALKTKRERKVAVG